MKSRKETNKKRVKGTKSHNSYTSRISKKKGNARTLNSKRQIRKKQ